MIIVGDGPERDRLEGVATSLGLDGIARFTGRLAEIGTVMRGLDVYLVTSLFEGGVSMSVLEAMAAGVPVVTTAAGGVEEAVVDGETGYVVTHDLERGALAAALAERAAALLVDPELRARMGAAGARRVREQFTVEQTAARTLRHLRTVPGSQERVAVARQGRSRVLRGKDIVCISSLDWSAMWTSKQQIMHRLAQTNRILYVEEPVTMLAPLKVPARWRRWGAVAPRLARVDAGLWTLTPPPTLPFGNMRPVINRANQTVLAQYIRWALERLYFDEEYIFWTYLPTSVGLLDRLGRRARAAGPAPRREPKRSTDALPPWWSTIAWTSTRPSRGS